MKKRKPLTADDVRGIFRKHGQEHALDQALGRPAVSPAGVSASATQPIAEKVKTPRKKTRTEMEYEAMLKREWPGCVILWERYTFKLSNDVRYTPDFAVIHVHSGNATEFHEVKGAYLFKGATKSATHTSLTKPKLAAEQFPWHRWFRATKDENGQWSREEYKKAE